MLWCVGRKKGDSEEKGWGSYCLLTSEAVVSMLVVLTPLWFGLVGVLEFA